MNLSVLVCFSVFPSVAESDIVERKCRPDIAQQAKRQNLADEEHHQSEQPGKKNDSALGKFVPLVLRMEVLQPVQ